jgi:hypothetical protein
MVVPIVLEVLFIGWLKRRHGALPSRATAVPAEIASVWRGYAVGFVVVVAAMATLANAPSASFRFLRDQPEISESDLLKQMSTIETAGYVTMAKDGHGRGPAPRMP